MYPSPTPPPPPPAISQKKKKTNRYNRWCGTGLLLGVNGESKCLVQKKNQAFAFTANFCYKRRDRYELEMICLIEDGSDDPEKNTSFYDSKSIVLQL